MTKFKDIAMCLNEHTYIDIRTFSPDGELHMLVGGLVSENHEALYKYLDREVELIYPRHMPRKDILVIQII